MGAALIRQGHKIAGELGYSWSLVLGSETYYPKFGYVPAEKVGIQVPEGFPSPIFMAARLREEAAPGIKEKWSMHRNLACDQRNLRISLKRRQDMNKVYEKDGYVLR